MAPRRPHTPRPHPIVPSYKLHEPSGLAYTTIDGRRVYLGRHGTPATREKHARVVRSAATDRPVDPEPKAGVEPEAVTVMMVLAGFWTHVTRFYAYDASYEGRRPPGEIGNYYDAMGPVMKLYGNTPAVDFKPNALKLVQAEMVARRWCRNVVNRQTCRVTHMFKGPCPRS